MVAANLIHDVPVHGSRTGLAATVESAPGRAFITFTGRLNIEAAHVARDTIRGLQRHGTHLTLDLSRVDEIDAAGLGVLVASLRRAESSGGSLSVTHASPAVHAAITTIGLTSMLRSGTRG